MRDLPDIDPLAADYWSLTLAQRQQLRDGAKRRAAVERARAADRIFAANLAWFQRPGVVIGLDPTLMPPPGARPARSGDRSGAQAPG